MAQRKSSSSGAAKKAQAAKSSARAAASSGSSSGASSATKVAAGRAGAGAKASAAGGSASKVSSKVSTSKPASGSAGRPGGKPSDAARKSTGSRPPGGRPPAKKSGGKGKSIVNQKQTPWGLIATTAAIVVFAAAVVIVVIATHKSGSDGLPTATSRGGQAVKASDPYRQPELAAAKKIKGVVYTVQGQHNHETGHIKYQQSPPDGGNHNAFWADCTGTVYSKAIANENAVHMLEHGAIWITYNPDDISGAKLTALKKYVSGVNYMALSPYPNLKTPISMQSWGYQLFLSSPSDPRIAQFISTLRLNKTTTPEYGSSCSNPVFKQNPSTFGHPTSS